MAPDSQGHKDEPETPQKQRHMPHDSSEESRSSTESEEDDDEEEGEPRLKYAALTKGQGPLYRNGDAVSAFLVAGDKMAIGTHNGNVHVFSLPSFNSLRVYHAHIASVSAISVSPFPPPLPVRPDQKTTAESNESPLRNTASPVGKGQKQAPVPNVPSNNIYIGTSSIDGNVCVSSLVHPEDVVLRKFGRPVQAVAVSPSYRSDRTYLSGGKAGNLVLTIGGQAGKSATSTTTSGTPLSSGWLGALGLGANNGTDTVLHSGEGSISIIKWSLSGKFVVWVNEYGIKIMRTHLHLGSEDLDWAWKRVSHIDRPGGDLWNEMASVWMARAEWIDEEGLELEDEDQSIPSVTKNGVEPDDQSVRSNISTNVTRVELKKERLVVGWGGSIWVLDISDGVRGTGKDRRIGRVEVVTILRTDCIVSGVSLYTPNLLIILAYVTPQEIHSRHSEKAEGTPKRGITRRQNALQPEMRIIDISTKPPNEVSADTLKVSRFESLTAADYHLGVLPVMRASTKTTTQRGTLEVLGNIGGSIWDASMYSSKFLGSAAVDATLYSAQLFTSGASMRSGHSSGGKSGTLGKESTSGLIPVKPSLPPDSALLTRSMKIFIHSPYDCVLATKPTRSDHLKWLLEHEKYEEAWNDLDAHPDAAGGASEVPERTPTASTPSTPTRAQSNTLFDFFDDTSSATKKTKDFFSQSEKEKRRIGDKWVKQLVDADNWTTAGQVCGKVLGTASSWEHWVWVFAESKKHSEIAPYIPTQPMRPPLSSTVYELILAYYISQDRPRLVELLHRWSPELFNIESVITAIQSKLRTGEVTEESTEDGIKGRDWRILMECLAKLYVANGQIRDALKCYIKLQDADTALALIRTHHLIDVVADDIPGLLLLRISKQQQKEGSLSDLEELSAEPIRLLVLEAHHGIVAPAMVVKQLSLRKDMQPFLFFYFRALWNGDTADDPDTAAKRTVRDATTHRLANEGKSLVNDFADTALPSFAEYDRPLLFEFLKASQSYTLSLASSICEKRNYVPEFVYLLSKEGRTKKALFIIIEKLNDVSQAISFAKEQNDLDLWDDLLNYSMNKPAFIRALLEEIGTAIDPIKLVRKIPEGLEIMGLRDSLTRMIREFELQDSISEGAARVFHGEVATRMSKLRAGQKSGIRFDIVSIDHATRRPSLSVEDRKARRRIGPDKIKHGHCCGCGEVFVDEDSYLSAPRNNDGLDHEPEAVLSFPCFHAFHLSCLLRYDTTSFSRPNKPKAKTKVENKTDKDEHEHENRNIGGDDDADLPRLPPLGEARNVLDRGAGPKVRYAEELNCTLGKGGCPLDMHKAGRGSGEW